MKLNRWFPGKAFANALFLLLASAFWVIANTTNGPMIAVGPDWHAEIVAQAPAIRAPSVVCCAPDGRIFMGEDLMDMDSPTDKPGDKIVCIHPDGKITTFATNLYAVFGMQYIDGKLYVHHTPKFSVFDDVNSVGVNRVDLITNENPHPWLPSFNDHIPSGFRLAMDGYFYITTGDKGILGAVGTDGRKIEMRGGVYRMRPDGTGLEVYCTGTRNHLNVGINDEDEMFTFDNTDDGGGWWKRETHMVDGGYYGYPFDFKPQKPYTLWMMTDFNSEAGAPTDEVCYNEDALPAEYHGNLFQCDWSSCYVQRAQLKRTGSTYEIARRVLDLKRPLAGDVNNFFIARGGIDTAFRPVGITVTPDGMGFYLTDWGVCGWKRGDVVGRLFKVTYTGKSHAEAKPKWFVAAATGRKFSASTRELVHALSHPAQSVRLEAQRKLAERHFSGESKLVKLLKQTSAPAYARWSAIWTLDAIDGGKKDRAAIIAALQDKDPTVQSQAARQLGTRGAKEAVGPLLALLDTTTNEMLKFRAATALGRIGDPGAIRLLKHALVQKDLFARYAAFKALSRIGLADGKAWPEIVMGFDSVVPEIREATLFATRETYDVALVKALAEFAAKREIPTEARTNVLNLLASLYQKQPAWNGDWWNTMPVNGSPAAKTENWGGTPVVTAAMRNALLDEQAAIRMIAFEWVRSSHDTNSASLLRGMYEHETNVSMRATILRALPAKNDADTKAIIGPILENPKADISLQEAAIETAQKMGATEWRDDLIHLAQSPVDPRVLMQLFQVFGGSKLAPAVPLLATNLSNSNPSVRQSANMALISIGGDAAIAVFLGRLTNSSVDTRRDAIDALGSLHARSAVPQLLTLTNDSLLGISAVQTLTQIPDVAALDVYLDGLASKNATLRSQCRTAVTTLRQAALPLIEAKLKSTNGLPDDTVASLREIYQTDAAAKKGPIFKVKVKLMPIGDYQSYGLANLGNSLHGEQIFTDINGVNCIRCHTINGKGGHIGPDLTGIGTRQSRAQIIESVLYPSKQILDGYQQVYFHMKDDDDDRAGIVRTETPDTVTIVDSLGMTNVLPKSKIKDRKISQVSLMPEGLQTGLTLEDFSDLIAYVENRKPVIPPPQRSPGMAAHLPARIEPERGRFRPGPNMPARSAPQPGGLQLNQKSSDPIAFLSLPPLPLPAEEPSAVEEPEAPIQPPSPRVVVSTPALVPPPAPANTPDQVTPPSPPMPEMPVPPRRPHHHHSVTNLLVAPPAPPGLVNPPGPPRPLH